SDVENKHDEKLFEELRQKRKKLADEHGIPPYTIFPDTTLMEMSFYFPQDSDSLLRIYGVGAAKEKRYGRIFLTIIKDYSVKNNIEELRKSLKKFNCKKSIGKKYERIGQAFNDVQSIEHLAEEQGIKQLTILKHLKT